MLKIKKGTSLSSQEKDDKHDLKINAGGGIKYIPQPYQQKRLLYTMHLSFAFVSRMWDMGIVLLIAELTNNSLFVVALAGFLSSLAQFLCMSIIGDWLDKTDRMAAVKIALTIKISVVSLAYLLCALFSADVQAVGIFVYILPILCAIASVSFATITQSIERDWIIVLSDGDSAWLTSTNSAMSQIDLICASSAPAVTGILFGACNQTFLALLLLCSNGAATVLLYTFMRYLYGSWPALASRSKSHALAAAAVGSSNDADCAANALSDPTSSEAKMQALIKSLGESDAEFDSVGDDDHSTFRKEQPSRPKQFPFAQLYAAYDSIVDCIPPYIQDFFAAITIGVFEFVQSGCAGPMLAYSFLFFTVLSFGSLMTVYLRWAGISDYWVGVSRGLSAVFGFAGAWAFPHAKERWGLWQAGQNALWFQFSLVALAASSFYWLPTQSSVVVVIVSVLFSRVGLWMFDLCARQIAQESIQESVRGKVNGTWGAITSFFDMAGYGSALIFSDPASFYILTTISSLMILLAAATFTMSNPHSNRPWVRAVFSPLNSSSHHSSQRASAVEGEEDDEVLGEQTVETVTFSPISTSKLSKEDDQIPPRIILAKGSKKGGGSESSTS